MAVKMGLPAGRRYRRSSNSGSPQAGTMRIWERGAERSQVGQW